MEESNLDKNAIFLPSLLPRERKLNWNSAAARGIAMVFIPDTALLIPTPKESMERAKPRYRASIASTDFELSKSQEGGLRIIWMVTPRERIMRWNTVFSF